MSIHREHHLDLCAGLVLGALDDRDRREIEHHLAEGCRECEAELRQLADGATLLAAAAPPVTPPPALRDRVLRAHAPESPRALRISARRRSSFSWGWAAAVVFAAAGIVTWLASERMRGELAATRQQLDAARDQLVERQKELADERGWTALLEGTGTRVVDLQLTPQGSAMLRGRVIYDPQARRAIIVFNHVAPPSGSDYQLWALRDGRPESLGLIHPDATGRAVVKLPDTGDPSGLGAFAVSLEKAGGSTSPGPEGPIVMLGKVGS